MAFETSTRRCVLNGMLVAVAYLSIAVSSSSSFREATDRSGSVLCATQQPSVVYDVAEMDLPPINFESAPPPPPSALCSWKCTREPDCISFNWKVTTRECELFYYVPTECGISCDCVHYESMTCGRTSCGFDVLNMTADNVIVQLFIDGCEVQNLTNAADWTQSDSVWLPLSSEVIAVQIANVGSVSGLLASSSLLVTDHTWKATNTYLPGWMNVRFDDSSWENATEYGANGAPPWSFVSGISPRASWISTRNISVDAIYYRLHIKQGKVKP